MRLYSIHRGCNGKLSGFHGRCDALQDPVISAESVMQGPW